MQIEECILAELKQRRPARLTAVDEAACKLAQSHLAAHPGCGMVAMGDAADFAIAFLDMSMGKMQAISLIGRLKQNAPVILIAAGLNTPLEFADYLSFGMQRLVESDERGHALYLFDLHTYKPAPDWLNARYWANPERWKP